MGRDLQLGRHFPRSNLYDPYNTVQFHIPTSDVTAGVRLSHRACDEAQLTVCVFYPELTDEQVYLFWVKLPRFLFLIDKLLIIRPKTATQI